MATYIQYIGSGFSLDTRRLSITMPGGLLKVQGQKNYVYVEYVIDRTLKYLTYFNRADYVYHDDYDQPYPYELKTDMKHILAGRTLMRDDNVSELTLHSRGQSKNMYDYSTELPRVTGENVSRSVDLVLKLGEVKPFRFFPDMVPDLTIDMILVHA